GMGGGVGDYKDSEKRLDVLAAQADQIGAVILEPMMGSGGCIPARREFLVALAAACRNHGALLIFDEVMTSRHSAGGLQKLTGVAPDLTTLGKYVAGGMSFGAFCGRAGVMERVVAHRPGGPFHSGTFQDTGVSMTRALSW